MAKLQDQKQVLGKVLRRVRRYWPALILSLVLATVYVAMSLYIPILVGLAIDGIIAAGQVRFDSVAGYLVKIGICAGVAGVAQWVMNELNNRVTYRVTKDIRDEACDLGCGYLC